MPSRPPPLPARTAAARRQALLQAALDCSSDGILVADRAGHAWACNTRLAEIWAPDAPRLASFQLAAGPLGHDAAGLLAWMGRQLADPAAQEPRLRQLLESSGGSRREQLPLRDGRVLECRAHPLRPGGRSQARVLAFSDLSDAIDTQRRLQALARTDVLTGLPNMRAAQERIGAACTGSGGFALLLIDLDRFQRINETWGHTTGDHVLRGAVQRMQAVVRSDDLLMRLEGDQFVLLMPGADARTAEAAARRLLKAVAQPCELGGETFTLTGSAGLVLCPAHGRSADELLRHADAAMRRAKAAGRACWHAHERRQETDRRQQMKLEHALRQAFVGQRLQLHYQPRVALADGRLLGAEALLRWHDAELGDVAPSAFIPAAEHSGLIVEIGEWVLHQAVRQAALWHAAGQALPVAVNVSALQFQHPQFAERVANALAVSGLPPHLLELELTESILLHDGAEALRRLNALAALGVGLAIDDFGTGYSSLAYLKRLPVGTLKIDRSFVQGLPADDTDAGIVSAIVQMAQALRMDVIAEGVETEAQREFLARVGCQAFQGWLFAPALDGASFEQRLLQAPARPLRAAGAAARSPRGGGGFIRLVSG